MKKGKFNVVTDGQWGSCGKGMVSSALIAKYKPEILSTTNMPNAGHSAENTNGERFVAKALPAGAIMRRWLPDYSPLVMVGASAAFYVDRLLKEVALVGARTAVHPRAGVVTDAHKEGEAGVGEFSTKHVASTMQGCGAFLAEKVLRKEGLVLARDLEELKELVDLKFLHTAHGALARGETILHEGSQGFSLDINHGSHYPHCTSRGTTATQNMADMGVNVKLLGDVYMVVRPYPIRVGNVMEEGSTVGYSGDCYADQEEISWEEVGRRAGMLREDVSSLLDRELTTVTKRLRRVFTFSERQLKEATMVNGPDFLFINFANYIDARCAGLSSWDGLSDVVLDFVRWCESVSGVRVVGVGTGPRWCDVCWRPGHAGTLPRTADIDDAVS